MLKIVFKSPQKILQDGLECECMHVFAFATSYMFDGKNRAVWTSENEYTLVDEDMIHSIKQVKPTDL